MNTYQLRSFWILLFITTLHSAEPNPNTVPTTVNAPIKRTLTDSQGRELIGSILGRSGDKIQFRRSDGKEFTIAIDTLADTDREFLAALPEGMFGQAPVTKPTKVGEPLKAAPAPEPANAIKLAKSEYEPISDGTERFLALPFTKQDKNGICAAAALLNVLQYLEPDINMTQAELFDVFRGKGGGANSGHVQAALTTFGYRSECIYFTRENKEEAIKAIQRSIMEGYPVLSGSTSHLMVTVGYNNDKNTLTLWDQRQEVDNHIEKKPKGTSEPTEAEYIKKISSFIRLSPMPSYETLNPSAKGVSEKTLETHFGKAMKLYKMTPSFNEPDLTEYLEHAMEPRLAVEFRRQRRVLIPKAAISFIEILGEPTNKIWKIKEFPDGKEETIKEKDLIKLLVSNSGEFFAIPPAPLLGQ